MLVLRLGIFTLLLLWTVVFMGQPRVRISFGGLGKPVGIFLLFCAVSALSSGDRFISFFGSHQLWFWGLWSLLAYGGIYLMAANAPTFRRTFLAAFLFASFGVSLYALLQRLGWDPIWKGSSPAFPFTATLGNPNYLGVLTAMAVPIALYFSLEGPLALRIFSGLTAYLNFLICALALTRGAWLGLGLGLLLWMFLSRHLWRKSRTTLLLLFLGFAGLGAYAVWPTSVTGSSPVLDRSKVMADPQEHSAAARLSLWRSSGRLFLSRPLFGVGLDLFGHYFPRYQEVLHRRRGGAFKIATNAHNEPLQVLTTLGLLGFAAYLWLWVSAVRLFIRQWKISTEADKVLWASIAASAVALQTHALFNFSITATSAHLWCWFGLLQNDQDLRLEVRPPLWLKSTLCVAAAGLLLFVATQSAGYALADWHTRQGERQQGFMRPESALFAYDAARERFPLYYPAYVRSANARVALAKKEKDPAKRRAYFYQAIDICAQAVERFPWLPEAPHNLGWTYCLVHEQLGDNVADKGVAHLKRAVELAPMYPEFWTNYAHALELAGKPEESQQALVKALEIVPTYPPAMKKLAAHMPKKQVRFIEQDLVLKNVPLGKPVRISQAAGQPFKLMNLDSESFRVALQAASVEETPYFLPEGYRSLGAGYRLSFDQNTFDLKPDTILTVDGTLQLPDDHRLRGTKLGIVVLARLVDFRLPAGAYARLLIETSPEAQ